MRARFMLILTLLLAACSPAAPALTDDQLANAVYPDLSGYPTAPDSIQLQNGVFQTGSESSEAGFMQARMDPRTARGDLNGDGNPDAAVLISENYGGTGVFVYLAAMINIDGSPVFEAAVLIDDRPIINEMEIQSGEIRIDAVVHGAGDPMCCPTLPVVRRYFLLPETGLVLGGAASRVSAGLWREISIEQPAAGVEAAGSLRLTGSVTVAPFENTLAMRLYDSSNTLVLSGPLNVTSAEMGGPGTFDQLVDLTGLPDGNYRLDVADLSMADGSVLALDSLFFLVVQP